VSASYPLAQAAEAMNLLASRKAKGKVVIRIGA
jgi:NADPH:quinone reductase-like Zn-dependent oxidoreductase